MIPEDDIFDKIFNQYNKNVLPSSFIENFEKFYRYEDDICKRIKNLGSAVLFLESDIYRFFAIKIKRRGGKLINFQHGGLNRMRKFSLEELFVDSYADLDFWWHDKNGIGVPYFDNHKPNYKSNDEILFFPTINLYQETTVNLKKCNHINLNQYWKFFELMKNDLKAKVKIKLMHHKNSDSLKRIWEKKYNKNIILNKKNYKGSVFKNFKIVIIDNYSTPLFELLYISHPFIIINDSKLIEYNKDFREIVQKLNQLGILFKSETKAAQFINSNYQNIDLWWKKIIKKKKFRQIKKKLYPKEKFDYQKLFYNLEK
jgi:putative transferase (TIGR04331 family)